MHDCSRNIVEEALVRTGGNKRKAARDLGMSREGLYFVLDRAESGT
jgi:DNA-binding NtrC family response regulator